MTEEAWRHPECELAGLRWPAGPPPCRGMQGLAPQHCAGAALTSGRFWGSPGVTAELGLLAPCAGPPAVP